jgi:hypothetical protein
MSDANNKKSESNEPLDEAMQDLERAEHDVEKATEKIEEVIEEGKHRHEFKVEVLYNGVKKSFEVRRDELVNALLDKAIKEFGPIPNPHLLSLFTEGGDELDGAKTIEAAGVGPGEVLLLRPSQVKGGK